MTTPTGILFADPRVKPISTVGLQQAGCYLYFYLTGTTTQTNVYADGALTTPLSQPVTADSAGRFVAIYMNPSTIYRVQLYNAGGSLLEDTDPYVVAGADAVTRANVGQALYPVNAAETTLGVTPTNIWYPYGNALRYGADPTGVADSTAAIQNALNVAWMAKIGCYVPGGLYTISSELVINQASASSEYRGDGFRFYGDGSGNVEDQGDQRTTVVQTSSNITMLRYIQYLGTGTDSGNYFVEGIRWQQNSSSSTAPVVQLDVLGSFSRWSQCDIWNAGTGDGLRCLEFTQALIERSHIENRDYTAANTWNSTTAYVVGNTVINGQTLYICTANNTNKAPPNATYWSVYSRSAAGVNIFAQYNAGLGLIRNVSVRGFQNGIVMGDTSGNSTFGMTAEMCDVSNVGYGITINTNGEADRIVGCYFEGCEVKDILNKGRNSVIRDNVCLTASRTVVIDCSTSAGGDVIEGNDVQMSTYYLNGAGGAGVPNNIGIAVATTNFLGASVTNNRIGWGFSGTGVAGVIGLQLSGSANNPPISHNGNIFSPNAQWSGGTGTSAISDKTTSSSGSSGSGIVGFGQAADSSLFFPRMARGALGLWLGATLADAAIASGILTLTGATMHKLTCSGTQTITSINPVGVPEGHLFSIWVTNNKVTFAAGVELNLSGSTNYTVGTNGCIITFFMQDNAAYEVCRTAY